MRANAICFWFLTFGFAESCCSAVTASFCIATQRHSAYVVVVAEASVSTAYYYHTYAINQIILSQILLIGTFEWIGGWGLSVDEESSSCLAQKEHCCC